MQLGRVDGVLSLIPPPDDSTPADFLAALGDVRTGAAGIAELAGEWLEYQGKMPEAVRAALGDVQAAAQAIVDRVNAYLGPTY